MTNPPHLPLILPPGPGPLPRTHEGEERRTAHLALLSAALATETPASDAGSAAQAAACAHLAGLIEPDGTAPRWTGGSEDDPTPDAGLWATLALLLAAPGPYAAAAAPGIEAARAYTRGPVYRPDVPMNTARPYDDPPARHPTTTPLARLRDAALAGLVLHAAATAYGDDALHSDAREALLAALRTHRAADGTRYASAVTPQRGAIMQRDTQGAALLCLLALRLRADDYADELLTHLEGYACAQYTPAGQATGYADGPSDAPPAVHVMGTVLAACAQREAGRTGEARATLAGLTPLRAPDGILAGLPALTTAADAALDDRFLQPAVAAGLAG